MRVDISPPPSLVNRIKELEEQVRQLTIANEKGTVLLVERIKWENEKLIAENKRIRGECHCLDSRRHRQIAAELSKENAELRTKQDDLDRIKSSLREIVTVSRQRHSSIFKGSGK